MENPISPPGADNTVWLESPNALQFCNELLATDFTSLCEIGGVAHTLKEGLVTKRVRDQFLIPPEMLASKESPKNVVSYADLPFSHVIIRDVVQRIWQVAFDYLGLTGPTRKTSRVLLTGNPGIGKSWSLIYGLYLLLKEKKTVFFHSIKHGRLFAFIYDQERGKYRCFQTRDGFSANDALKVGALFHPHHVYLFDPNETEMAVLVDALTVVATSPDAEKTKLLDKTLGIPLYVPMWEMKDLEAAAVLIPELKDPKVSPLTLQDRFNIVHGEIRALVNAETIRARIDSVDRLMSELHENAKVAMLRQASTRQPHKLLTSRDSAPPNVSTTLFRFDSTSPFTGGFTSVVPRSAFVIERLRTDLYTSSYKRGVEDDREWETHCQSALSLGLVFQCYDLIPPKQRKQASTASPDDPTSPRELIPPKQSKQASTASPDARTSPRELRVLSNLPLFSVTSSQEDLLSTWRGLTIEDTSLPQASLKINCLIASNKLNFALIDFASHRNVAYNATRQVNPKRDGCTVDTVKELLDALKITPDKPLVLYHMVPEKYRRNWVNNLRRMQFASPNNSKASVDEDFDGRLVQRLLIVPARR